MWDTVIGYVFCLVLGLAGLGVAGWLLITGRAVESTDGLFLLLVALLFAAVSFGYLALQIGPGLSQDDGKKKGR